MTASVASTSNKVATHPPARPIARESGLEFESAVQDGESRSLARTVAALAERDVALAHASLATALVVVGLRWLGASEALQPLADGSAPRLGLSLAPPAGSLGASARIDRSASGLARVALKQRFFAGADNPDHLLVIAAPETGGFAALVEANDVRLRFSVDEPAFGLASTRRGWIELEGSFSDDESLALRREPFESIPERLQDLAELMHLSMDYGALRGFFARAKTYLSTQSRPWDSTGLARATDDPHIVRQWGGFTAQINALSALYEEALAEAEAKSEGRNEESTSPALVVARSYVASLAGPLISGVIEILGASATSDRHGFDLFWRDLTAHALDDPPLRDIEGIGRTTIARARARSSTSTNGEGK